MPLLGTIMTIDAAGSPTTASNSVLDENMTWPRPTGGYTSSANEPHAIDTVTILTDDRHRPLSTTGPDHVATTLVDRASTGPTPSVPADRRPPATDQETEIAALPPTTTEEIETETETEIEIERSTTSGEEQRAEEEEDCACGGYEDTSRLPFLVAGEDLEAGSNNTGSVDGSSPGSIIEEASTGVGGTSTTSTSTSTDLEDVEGLRELEVLFGLNGIMEDLDGSFNDSFNESLLFPCNGSLCNETYVVLGESLYPSGYTILQIVLASVLVTLLMIVIVVGNMLVIIAIATEKALKNIQNWFIASLAVADFFLGLVIMPFSLANEIMGYWIFGYWWCDIYSAMDVLLCTASIMNLCLISLDRYWSITQAVDYLKKRTPARAALMIALVWLLSALVCIPPLLGWKRPTPAEEYPKCKLSEDIGYVLYSALGSFYIPSCIMVFVYIRIYFAAKARARRGIRKPRPRAVVPPESPDVRQTSFTQSTPATEAKKPPSGSAMENVATIENQPVQIPIVTCDFASDVSTSEADPGGGSSIPMEEKDTLKVTMPVPVQKSSLKATLSVNGDGQQSSVPSRCRAPSVGIDVDMVSEFDPSSSDSGVVSRCAVVKPLKLRLCQPIFGRRNIGKLRREHGGDGGRAGGKDEAGGEAKSSKPRDPEREKRRLAPWLLAT